MKKLIIILLISVCANFAQAQTKHKKISIHFDSPMFKKQGWIAPALTGFGTLYFGYKAIQANNKTIHVNLDHGQSYSYIDDNARKAALLYSGICAATTIGIIISFQSDK